MNHLFLRVCVGAFFAVRSWAGDAVEITTPELRGAVQPQLAVAPSGKTSVVFGKGNAIYYAGDDGRLQFSPPVKVGEVEKLALKMRRGPRVAATDRLILVTAISHADGNVHAWTSSDGGKSFVSRPALNTVAGSAREGMMGLAGDGTGNVAAVWLDLRGAGTQLWGRFSSDGGTTWGAERMLYTSPDGHICECCHPSVAFAPGGELVVMWRNWLKGARDLYAITSKDKGATFSPAQKLGEGTWTLNGCPMDGGSLAAGPDGKWRAVWRRENSLFTHPWGAAETRLATDGRQPVIGFAGKEPLMLWEQGKGLQLQEASGKVSRFAEVGSGAAIASGRDWATIAWEVGEGGGHRIFVRRHPQGR